MLRDGKLLGNSEYKFLSPFKSRLQQSLIYISDPTRNKYIEWIPAQFQYPSALSFSVVSPQRSRSTTPFVIPRESNKFSSVDARPAPFIYLIV
jgi:hypothetical protein